MTVRTVVGLAWALVAGLGGGWLVAAPWALGEQPSGAAWTTVTSAQVGTGLGLVLLALIGVVLVTVQVVGAVREAGALLRPPARHEEQAMIPPPEPWGPPQPAPAPSEGSEDEAALISLAQALANELTQHELSQQQQRQWQEEHEPSATWRAER